MSKIGWFFVAATAVIILLALGIFNASHVETVSDVVVVPIAPPPPSGCDKCEAPTGQPEPVVPEDVPPLPTPKPYVPTPNPYIPPEHNPLVPHENWGQPKAE